jgi:cystathionine gamma-synthase
METAVTRDLLSDPAWREEDLGKPLPDSSHACSMCLPTWETVLGYEEKREKVMKRLRAGYPRFFRHPVVERLFGDAKAEIAGEQEEVIVLPTRSSVQRAHRWVELRSGVAVRIASFHGLQVLVVPSRVQETADLYWRVAGEVVSSRQAQDFLDGAMREGGKSHLVARAMAKFTGAAPEDHFVFASGMAAVGAALRALPGLREGKKTLQIEFPYVDSLKAQEFFGHGLVYLNEARGESYDEALARIRQGEFAGVFTEVPSNPLLRTADLERLAEACALGRTPLVLDDSAAGPLNVRCLEYADVVTSSLTKWVSGEGDVMAGMATVRADSPHAEGLRQSLAADAVDLAPLYIGDAEILLSNLREYPKRMEAVNANGLAVAGWLAEHPAVARVWHPSRESRSEYEAVMRPGGGFGGLLSFVLKAPKRTPRVYDALRLSKGPGFGTRFTLVCPYTQLAHYQELEWAEGCGVPAHLLRISCGVESTETLIGALEEALAQV